MHSVRAWWAGALIAITQIGLFALPARANDTRTSCCADLEALISQLTAAVSRSDNSERYIRIYGQLNRAVMFWDDGKKSSAYAVDNQTSSSRLGLVGKHEMLGDLSTGYRIEIDSRVTSSSKVSSGDAWGDLSEGAVQLRHAYWYVDDRKFGRLTFGQQSPASDDVTLINLGSQMNDAALHYNNNFSIWLNLGSGLNTDLKWGQIAHNVDSLRGLFVRYDTPVMGGAILSAAAGEDGVWDVAARYQADWHPFRFAVGVGYMENQDQRFRDVRGSASLIHDPTGVYVSVAGGLRNDDVSVLSASGQAYFHYMQLGISKQWLPYGKTTLYADYGLYKNFNVGDLLQADLAHPGDFVVWGTLAETEVLRWGFGAEQAFDKSGLLLYAQAHHYQAEVIGFPCSPFPPVSPETCGGDPVNGLTTLPTRPWFGFVAGARIRF
jgi:predicted porin